MTGKISQFDIQARTFELELQRSIPIEEQQKMLEKNPALYFKEIAKIVVKVINFQKDNPSYRLPENYSLGMCTHKLKGFCTFDAKNSKVPCLNPHSFFLRKAAIYLNHLEIEKKNPLHKTKPCKADNTCLFQERCKFLHKEDVAIRRHVLEIFEEKAKKKSQKKLGRTGEWTIIPKNRRLPLAKKEKKSSPLLPDPCSLDNPFASLEHAELLSSTSDDDFSDSTSFELSWDLNPANPDMQNMVGVSKIETSDSDGELPDIVQSVFDAVFDREETDDEESAAARELSTPFTDQELVPFDFDGSADESDFKALEEESEALASQELVPFDFDGSADESDFKALEEESETLTS